MEKSILKGHAAAAAAYFIFGFNILFCKDLTSAGFLSPMALFVMRAAGASLLFWIASLFLPREKVEPRDMPKIALAALIGFVIVQMTFLFAIPQSNPLDVAVISTLGPVFTMLFAALFVKEPITLKKAGGVLMSFVGIVLIILNSSHASSGSTSATAFVLLFMNVISFAAYLGIFRPLIAKYSVVTFMKWIFLFSFVATAPFAAKEIVTFNYASVPTHIFLELAYLVVMATFVAYFLIPVAQKHIRPTLVSMYSYLQPIIAAVVGIAAGTDKPSVLKVISVLLVCTGVWVVNNSKGK